MKHALFAALLFISACGQSTVQAPAPAPSGKPEVQAVVAQASPGAFLHGRWGDSGDCKKDIVFNADGTFQSYTGGAGQWSLSGDTLTMSGAGGVFTLGVRQLDANTVETTSPDGSVVLSQRC